MTLYNQSLLSIPLPAGAGFFFGNLPFVQKNFTLVVLAIVAVSVVPVIYEIIVARREAAESAAKGSCESSTGSTGKKEGGDVPPGSGGVNFA